MNYKQRGAGLKISLKFLLPTLDDNILIVYVFIDKIETCGNNY